MRHLFFTGAESGLSRSALRTGERNRMWRSLGSGQYRLGSHDPTPLEQAVGLALATGGVVSGTAAAMLLGLDGLWGRCRCDVSVAPRQSHLRATVRRRHLDPSRVVLVEGIPCTDGLQTLVDLAAELSDERWEQALESCLRKRLVTIESIELALPELGRARTPGVSRMRRVLATRPAGAPPTESLLETLFVQLARQLPIPEPTRQWVVVDQHGTFVARVDISWPELGVFVELDGQQHKGQPVYDAMRQTDVVAATGWLVGRFTWDEVVHHPAVTRRRLLALLRRAGLSV